MWRVVRPGHVRDSLQLSDGHRHVIIGSAAWLILDNRSNHRTLQLVTIRGALRPLSSSTAVRLDAPIIWGYAHSGTNQKEYAQNPRRFVTAVADAAVPAVHWLLFQFPAKAKECR